MSEYGASTYGDRIAEVYDDFYKAVDPAMIDTLENLAGSGPVLELGIGTGRVALPLARRGVRVHGVDASEEMVRRLRDKPGGAEIPITMGDFADFHLAERFSLVYVPFNTLFGLLTQEDQVRCFRSAAAHLAEGGRFLIEVFVPDLARFDRRQRTHTNWISTDGAMLDLSCHDPVNQRVDTQHVLLQDGQIRLFPVQIRYAFPAELDLMAELAGLRLQHRWSDWSGAAFSAESQKHVSVYVKRDA